MAMIDFWFSIGSTYTYLSVMRLAEVAAETGIEFRWRPFNVRAIMIEMDNIPFAKKPAKAAYMWRDIERRAAMYR
ncbi:MAG: 2-hydroxychromene-2-carboxylate isomerase, partial [Mesorhizobium sp.]